MDYFVAITGKWWIFLMNVLNLATFTEEDASTVPKNLSSFEITEDKVYEKLTHLNVGQLIGELPPE